MTNKKITEKDTFNLKLAHLMADEYMRLADRSIKTASQQEKVERMASICLAISLLAFAMEIYMKSILYSVDNRTEGGHDLARLWKRLPSPLKHWLSDSFDKNFDSENETWRSFLLTSPQLRGKATKKVKLPEFTAYGMIKGHRNAFREGRYAYERPPGQKLKNILYNLNGLKILSWLIRELALLTSETVEDVRKKNEMEKIDKKIEIEIKIPKSIRPFPSL